MIKGATIMIHTHQTAPTQFIEANGIRFAYRRFGKTVGVPIVFNQHYIGTMDYWDPTVTDGLARDRQVILFNNAGVSSSSGEVPTTFEQMGANAIAFIKALGLKQVDVLGFSIGGMVAQEITLQSPDLVRRLIVDGTGPRGGQGMELLTQAAGRLFGATYDPPESIWLAVKFSPSAAGQAAGREYLKRTHLRQEGRDPEVNDRVSPAQVEAIRNWGVQREGSDDYMKTIKQPTLIVNGSNDVNIPTVNSLIMQQNMPNAQLIIYPDSNHGAHHQYPELFVEHATLFLNSSAPPPERLSMTQHTHQTAPTQFVEAKGIRFAYRRFGQPGETPLVFNMHFTGTMDHWDPLVTDGLAARREVILFDNAGVSSTSGKVPESAEEMAANAAAFIRALGLSKVDILGFSLGGMVAQALTLAEPDLVRRLVLVGTGPRGGEGMATLTPEAQAVFGATYANPDEAWLGAFFTPTEASQAAGRAFLKRFRLRVEGRDPEVSDRVAPAQLDALAKWGAPSAIALDYL